MHRWVRFLTQQTSITVYHLPTKETKLLFSVCSKQTEVCHFCFPFALNIKHYKHTYIYKGIYINIYTNIYLLPFQMVKWKPRRFSLTHLRFAHRANGNLPFVHFPTTKKWKLTVCKWTKRTCPSMIKC